MNTTKISILMPAFNAERFIKKSIESILYQNYKNYELVIIDDGSNDSTKEIIKSYCNTNEQIKLFTKSNSGIIETLNFGLEHCEGEWIARLDSDDLCSFDRLEKQLALTKSSKRIGLIGSNAIYIDENDNEIYRYSYPTKHKKLKNNLVSCKHFFPHSSVFFNKELIKSLGFYRKAAGISEDWDLWIRISEVKEIRSINQYLVKIRIHENQISNLNYISQAYDSRIAITCHWLRVKKDFDPIDNLNNNQYEKFKKSIISDLKFLGFDQYISFLLAIKKRNQKKLNWNYLLKEIFKNPGQFLHFIKFKIFSKNILQRIAKTNFKDFKKNIFNY